MSDETLLSELCSICFSEKPKYRCPRCKTRTCSLPCYKRHQQRATCNGKRDQAIYMKKSELATPAGIDHDYNYLKSVERTIDHASREATDRGVGGNASKVFGRGLHPESLMQRYLTTNRISVTRAPRGMSRQKTNQTRSTKRQHIMWTVEWVDAGGHRDVQDNCLESSSLIDIYHLMQLEKDTALRKSAAGDPSQPKVKRRRLDRQPDQASSTKQPGQKTVEDDQSKDESALEPATDNASVQADIPDSTSLRPDERPIESNTDADIETPLETQRHFYLLRTGTTSTAKVLIPLDAKASLTQSLKDRTVLEYPTIFVLPQPPDSLPDGFLLDKEYKKMRKGEEDEFQEALQSLGTPSTRNTVQAEARDDLPSHADAQRILVMLKRDITR